MTTGICIVKGCENTMSIKARRLCRAHYNKYYRCGLIIKRDKQEKSVRTFKNRIGERFGRLVVVGLAEIRTLYGNPRQFWSCRCECGNEKIVITSELTSGHVKSCSANCPAKFWDKLNEKYPVRDFEIIDTYENAKKKLLIKSKFGDCLITGRELLSGIKPSICNAIDKNQYFINKANDLYDNFYDYSKTNYKNMTGYLTITCPEHGDFKRQASEHIGQHKSGCPICGIKRRGNRTFGSERKGRSKSKTD